MPKPKLIRITTVSQSLKGLLKGQLSFMDKNGYEVVGVSAPGKELIDVKKDEDIRVIPILMTRSITPLKDLKSLYSLFFLLKKEKPAIVHTHTPKAGIVGMLAAKLAGVPHRLHTVAGLPLLEAKGNKRKLLDIVEKVTYACATKIYPNSFGLKEIILKNNFAKANKLKVLGNGSSNGIDTSYFDPKLISKDVKNKMRDGLQIRSTDFIFLFVGRLVGDKGINELVSAFGKLSRNYKDVHLVLVGKYENDLDPLSSGTLTAISNNSKIHAVGYRKNVINYFAMANVLVFPSYREGFPNVVLQAGAMELNAIVTDINGCNEIIRDNYNGFIIPVKNTTSLKEKMFWCYRNRLKSHRMGKKSRELIKNKFERKEFWKKQLKEYNHLIN